MDRTTLRLFCLFALLLTVAGITHATILAQWDYFAAGGTTFRQPFYSNYIIAQSFVPTVDGTVVSIDTTVEKYYTSSTNVPITFMITPVWDSGYEGLQPDIINPLSTGTLSTSDPLLSDMWINWVNTSMTHADLQAGTTYMLVATAPGTNRDYDWYYRSGGAGYAGGNMLIGRTGDAVLVNQVDDFPFRINGADAPETPEPATLGGLAIGLVALAALKRRFAQK